MKLAEGLRLLADHQYHLSLARQAFIKPCLAFVGKSAADQSTVDNWLFGSSFADDLKSAQACEKVGLTKPSSVPSAKIAQASQQPAPRAGNFKAPASRIPTAAHQHGATQRPSRSQRPRFRSRSRNRR